MNNIAHIPDLCLKSANFDEIFNDRLVRAQREIIIEKIHQILKEFVEKASSLIGLNIVILHEKKNMNFIALPDERIVKLIQDQGAEALDRMRKNDIHFLYLSDVYERIKKFNSCVLEGRLDSFRSDDPKLIFSSLIERENDLLGLINTTFEDTLTSKMIETQLSNWEKWENELKKNKEMLDEAFRLFNEHLEDLKEFRYKSI